MIENNKIQPHYEVAVINGCDFDALKFGYELEPSCNDFTVYFIKQGESLSS